MSIGVQHASVVRHRMTSTSSWQQSVRLCCSRFQLCVCRVWFFIVVYVLRLATSAAVSQTPPIVKYMCGMHHSSTLYFNLEKWNLNYLGTHTGILLNLHCRDQFIILELPICQQRGMSKLRVIEYNKKCRQKFKPNKTHKANIYYSIQG